MASTSAAFWAAASPGTGSAREGALSVLRLAAFAPRFFAPSLLPVF